MSETDKRCRACQTGTLETFVTVPDFEYGIAPGRYGRCSACGSFTQSPMPDDARLAASYPPGYHSFLPRSRLGDIRQNMRIKRLVKAAGEMTPDRVLLDYGCGQGAYLDALAEAFPQNRFLGYEIAGENQTETRHDGSVQIFRGSLDHLLANAPPFDIVCMNHVIEHLPEPANTIAKLAGKLKPGGVFEGQTPNAASFERALFGRRWAGFHSPRHTVVFSSAGLRTFFAQAGFRSVDVSPAFNPAGWAVSVGSAFQNAERPSGVKRQGLPWIMCLLAGVGPSLVESVTSGSGVVDYCARR